MAADNDDLEALFDQISSETLARLDALPSINSSAEPVSSNEESSVVDVCEICGQAETNEELYKRIGNLTRQLHDALRALGLDNDVENAVNAMPDARQRLDYIAQLTGQAAERALHNVEKGQEVASLLDSKSQSLRIMWQKMFAKELSIEDFKKLSNDTKNYFEQQSDHLDNIQSYFTDIMMAQDFHDLTGQVIQKVVALAQDIEASLVRLLVEATPLEKRHANVPGETLEGPIVSTAGRDDVVTSQEQVDDLLESLGF